MVSAHRFIWQRLVGPIPEGAEVDHLHSENTHCVNPAHLQAVTGREHRGVTAWRRRELERVSAQSPEVELEWSAGDRPMPSSEALAYAQRHRLPYYLLGVWHHVGEGSEGSR